MNFISSSLPDSDIELFFGPLSDQEPTTKMDPEKFTMADIAVHLGIFPSRNIASKNGWSKNPLPPGFGTKTVKIKKRPVQIAWLNTFSD